MKTLKRIQPGLRSDEAGLLGAFDLRRDLITSRREGLSARLQRILRATPTASEAGYSSPAGGGLPALRDRGTATGPCR